MRRRTRGGAGRQTGYRAVILSVCFANIGLLHASSSIF
jgi:hypothetical protein